MTVLDCIIFVFLWVPNDHASSPDCQKEDKIKVLNVQVNSVDFKQSNQGLATPINGIDDFIFQKWKEMGIPTNFLCDDATFLKRASIILTGRIPDPEFTRAFLESQDSQKRSLLIDELMQSQAFNTHWAFWFQEMFQSTGRILRGGRDIYNDYFQEVVETSKPLDQMAFELLTNLGLTDQVPEPNFYARANETVRLMQDFYDNAAIHAAQKFMGMQIECISCHDGAYHLESISPYLAEKKREDLWAMAAYFSELSRRPGTRTENLILSLNISKMRGGSEGYLAETDSGDRPSRNGGVITPKFLLTGSEPPSGDFLNSFAEELISNRQFARNFANRFWAHCFGLGLVEPIDAMDPYRIDPNYELPEGWDHQSEHLELLEYVTDLMIDSDYDMRIFLRHLVESATFQLSSQFEVGEWQESWLTTHARFIARRASAETIYDNLITATGDATRMVSLSANRESFITATYAHELADNDEPRGQRNEAITVFLNNFGRGNRFDIPRSTEGGIAQALLMMNSDVINSKLGSEASRLAAYSRQTNSLDDVIPNLYLDFLCRYPSKEEMSELKNTLAQFDDAQTQWETAVWLLANKLEFLFIF